MIIYNPLDGDAFTSAVPSNPRQCFLMTRLGSPIPDTVEKVRQRVTAICKEEKFTVIDATSRVTGRDLLLKIWKLIASTPLSIAICHEDIPKQTMANIYYELGVAQALGKETLLVKSTKMDIPSDLIRSEYVQLDSSFDEKFRNYLKSLEQQAEHYETVSDQLDRNPILAIDYLRRAFLITGNKRLREKAEAILNEAKLKERAKNSVEALVASF